MKNPEINLKNPSSVPELVLNNLSQTFFHQERCMGEGRLKGSGEGAKVQLVSRKIPGHVGLYTAAPAK